MNLIGQNQASINERACNNLMTIGVTISGFGGFKSLISAVTKLQKSSRIASERQRLAQIIAELTPFQKPFDEVKAAQSLLRTYLYNKTLSLSTAQEGQQKKGDRAVFTSEVPEVYNHLKNLEASADDAALALGDHWEAMRDDVIDVVRELEISVDDLLTMSGHDVARKFVTTVGTPQTLHVNDVSGMALPASLIERIDQESQDQLTKMLEGAKAQAITDTLEHMDLLVTQLTSGSRLSPSLIEHAKTHSTKLRGMALSYDNDPRLIAMCDSIDESIVNQTTDNWKSDDTAREASLETAINVKKNLAELTKPVSTERISYADVQIAGGLLDDLID